MSAESTREKRRRGPKQGVTGSSWRALRPRRSAALRSRETGVAEGEALSAFVVRRRPCGEHFDFLSPIHVQLERFAEPSSGDVIMPEDGDSACA